MGNIKIRKVKAEDAEKLRQLRLRLLQAYPSVYGTTYQSAARHGVGETTREIKEFSSPGAAIFVAEDGEKLVGMCRIEPTANKDIAYAGRLGVVPQYLGKGIGKDLFNYRYRWAKDNTDYKKITANVRKRNTGAVSFLTKAGFKIVGEGSYRGVPEWNLEMKIKR